MAETGQATRKQVDVNEILNNSRLQQQAVADGMTTFTFYDRNIGTYITIATDQSFGTREELLNYMLTYASDANKVRVFRPSGDYYYDASELVSIAWDAQPASQPAYMFDVIVNWARQEQGDPLQIARETLRPDQLDAFRRMYLAQAPARTPEVMIGLAWTGYEGGMSLSTRMTETGPVLTFSCGEPHYTIEIQFRDATAARQFVEDVNGQMVGMGVERQAVLDLEALRAALNLTPSGNISRISNVELGGEMSFNVDFTKQQLIDGIDRFLRRQG